MFIPSKNVAGILPSAYVWVSLLLPACVGQIGVADDPHERATLASSSVPALTIHVADEIDGARCFGDGESDDEACLRGILARARDAGGAVIVFPEEGSFMISRGLQVPAGTIIDGNGSTIVSRNTQLHHLLRISGSDVVVRGLRLVFWREANMALISFSRAVSHVVIEDCELRGPRAMWAILVNKPEISDVVIRDNFVSGFHWAIAVSTSGFAPGDAVQPELHMHDIHILRNTLRRINGSGIVVNSPVFNANPERDADFRTFAPGAGTHDVFIRGNSIETTETVPTGTGGFCVGFAGGARGEVTGNDLRICKYQALHLEDHAEDILFAHNRVGQVVGPIPDDGSDQRWDRGSSAVWMSSARRITIANNSFGPLAVAGVQTLRGYSQVTMPNDTPYEYSRSSFALTIRQNSFVGSSEYGFFMKHNMDGPGDWRIVDNRMTGPDIPCAVEDGLQGVVLRGNDFGCEAL